ncbi:MAG: TIGR01212 family radical SAM protein [Clostridiales bacterium]|nr:TIGR01212 family radical SAM protein [Clostridiales bacterium]
MFVYNSLNSYLKKRFVKKIYKLSVDCGFTCPNRDGSKGVGGCVFCSQGGSGEFASKGNDILNQLEDAKQRIKNKVKGNAGYICYFQSFTNTYAPVEKLRKLYYSVLNIKDIVAISIATRPDCLPDDVLNLLGELNKKIPVFVELGLQTSNEITANIINRCYENSCFSQAVEKLNKLNIEVIAHVIIGLPGENIQDYVNSVKYASECGIKGIKLQLLHVLKNTALEKMNYTPLTMDEYFYALKCCIENIPPEIVIHRLTGDGDKKILIKPLWSGNKHNVLNKLKNYMEENNVIQGSALNGQN